MVYAITRMRAMSVSCGMRPPRKKSEKPKLAQQHLNLPPDETKPDANKSMLLNLHLDITKIILKHAITTFSSMRGLFLSCKRFNNLLQLEYLSVRKNVF